MAVFSVLEPALTNKTVFLVGLGLEVGWLPLGYIVLYEKFVQNSLKDPPTSAQVLLNVRISSLQQVTV